MLNCEPGQAKWLYIFRELRHSGKIVAPKGEKIKELENFSIEFNPLTEVYCSFKGRNLSLKYLAGEFAWYLTGDRNDTRIENYSKFWKGIRNKYKPYYNSNYGYYFFTEKQFLNAWSLLVNDKDSRQACIMINNMEVALSESLDKLCTNAIMFRIRDNKLNMTVQMRSNDAVLGLGIDAVMFSWIYQLMYWMVKKQYPELEIGTYYHTAASFHIYERHWEMMDDIVMNNGMNYTDLQIPPISGLSESNFIMNSFSKIEENIREEKRFFEDYEGYYFINRLIRELMNRGK